MNCKRISALVLAFAMTASAAFAAEGETGPAEGDLPLLISANPDAESYDTVITVNGERVESYTYSQSVPGWGSKTVTAQLADLPRVSEGYVPMRAVAQADYGSAVWYEGDNRSSFAMGGARFEVRFEDLSVEVNGERAEGVSALLIDGVTYLPVSVFEGLEGFSVTDNSEGGTESYEISTPNGAPLMKLAYRIAGDSALLRGGSRTMEEMEEWYGELGFKAEYTTEGVAFLPLRTAPDTLILGRMAEGQEEALRTFLEAYRAGQEQTFSWYLGQHLPKVQNAQFVTEGDWFLFLIAEDVEAGVETFRAAVRAMESEACYKVPVVKEN